MEANNRAPVSVEQPGAHKTVRARTKTKNTTVADLLASTHPCSWHAQRSIEGFRRAAEAREGLFWWWALDAHPDQLDDESREYVATCWRLWVDGERPFKKARRRVA